MLFSKKKKISSIWLHYENCSKKYFHVFGNILKILFSYKIFTFSQPFSQQPNKFYYWKIQNIHLTTKNQNKNINQEEERVRSEGDRVTAKSQIQTQPNRNP